MNEALLKRRLVVQGEVADPKVESARDTTRDKEQVSVRKDDPNAKQDKKEIGDTKSFRAVKEEPVYSLSNHFEMAS